MYMWLSGYQFYCIGPFTLSADPYPTSQYKTRSSCFSNYYKDSVEKKSNVDFINKNAQNNSNKIVVEIFY
ncbi:hypothetical protein NC653_018863 [Populus alba x Populus x berolinensis]|uniref:Uncharacterized protein n=1 Tax=Populus alba x Populus x berolinensis TaxID=444605 RepID=A0AAD6QHF6_9ROSI|nr:hypothetical protein NC653_018863 [Populus alba x Populus x berolinensis]